MAKFSINASRIFLTYPQCPLPKEEVAATLKELVADRFRGVRVAHELHEDGSDHLHALLLSTKPVKTQNERYFDLKTATKTYHPNIQVARSAAAVQTYVAKGGDFVDLGLIQANGTGKRVTNRSDQAAALIQEGATFAQVVDAVPGFALQNKRKIEEMIDWVRIKKFKTDLTPLPMLAADLAEGPEREIAEWMDHELHGGKRPLKAPQLYVHGPPSIGKTTLVQTLATHLRVYTVPQDELFYDSYNDDDYDLIVFDEFKGNQKPLQWLNQFIDGSFMTIRKKGTQTLKAKNLPVIFLSNFTPPQAFSQAAAKGSVAFDAFLTRVKVVPVTRFMTDLLAALTPSPPVPSLPNSNQPIRSSGGVSDIIDLEENPCSPIDSSQPSGSGQSSHSSQRSMPYLNLSISNSQAEEEEFDVHDLSFSNFK